MAQTWFKPPDMSSYSNLGQIGGSGSNTLYRDSSGKYYLGNEGNIRAADANEYAGNQRISDIGEKRYGDQLKVTLPDQQQKLANEFNQNLPKYTGLLQDQSRKSIQRNLAENIQGLKQKSSNAGFLGGSATQKQQAEAIAGAQTDTMNKDLDIEDSLKSQAKQFENQALATKMSMSGAANQATIDALRKNILDSQRQSELWKALGGAVGTGIGAYYGRTT